MNSIPMPSISIFEQYGLAVYLALFFSIGIFCAAIALVWYNVKSNREERKDFQEERKDFQKLLSETIAANTLSVIQAASNLQELGALMKFHLESTGRLEEGHKRQRDEHMQLRETVRGGHDVINNVMVQVKGDLGTIHHDVEEIKSDLEKTSGKVYDIDRNVKNLGG